MTRLNTQLVNRFEDLAQWAPELTRDLPQSDLFGTWAWFTNLAQHGQDAQEHLALVGVRSDGANAHSHALPMCVQSGRAVALYGSVWTSLSNFYSSLFEPMGPAEGLNQAAMEAMLVAMKRERPRCAVLDLRPLDPGSPFYGHLCAALQAQGFAVRPYFCFGNWYLPTQGLSYSQYETSLPSRVQSTLKRNRKKLDAAGPWSITVEREPGPDLEAAIADWQAVYDKSWKVPEPFPAFVPQLIRMAAKHGWLRLAVLRLNGQAIAAQLWLIKDGKALIYKLAYDQGFSKFSAGSVLTAELMRSALDDEHVQEVDYLTGDDAYKRDWMSHRRERMGLAAFRITSVQGLSSMMRHDLGKLWRRYRPLPAEAPKANASEPAATAAA